jgi:hypothetical protein
MAYFPCSTAFGLGADIPSQSSPDIKNQYSYTSARFVWNHWHAME